jgi:hypothetical protein
MILRFGRFSSGKIKEKESISKEWRKNGLEVGQKITITNESDENDTTRKK